MGRNTILNGNLLWHGMIKIRDDERHVILDLTDVDWSIKDMITVAGIIRPKLIEAIGTQNGCLDLTINPSAVLVLE